MSLIGMGLYSFLRKAGTSFFTAGMAGSSFLLLYTGMTGNGIASQRAWIMFAMRMGAEITGREYDALTGLAAAAVWICLRQPLYLTRLASLFLCILAAPESEEDVYESTG